MSLSEDSIIDLGSGTVSVLRRAKENTKQGPSVTQSRTHPIYRAEGAAHFLRLVLAVDLAVKKLVEIL
jgi:hypothetical protein